jgi:hypothetical protein
LIEEWNDMPNHLPTRRHFLGTAATAGAALGMGEWAALAPLGPAHADEARVTPDLVRFGPDIEPVVKLIEETPQDRCVAVLVEQLRKGLPYRHFLAALYLAAIRAARWHGDGIHGYDHSAYVVHSAYQLSLDLPPGEQLLPAFYALTGFKGGQKAYPNKKGTPELTGKLPAADKALDELHTALGEWDPDRAERAIVALTRSRGRPEVLEPLYYYAGRDWGFIGHMAILVSNSCRLLETIGWQHAEHVLRYVVQGLAGWGKEHAEHPDVRPYWANLQRVEKAVRRLPGNWAEDQGNAGLTKDLLSLLREGKGDEACDLAMRHLTEGTARARAVWDAVHLAAGELVLSSKPHNAWRPINSSALHSNTGANALHYAFRASGKEDTRLLLTLQAVSWMDLYRKGVIKGKCLVNPVDITALTGAKLPEQPEAAIDAILATRTAQPHEAARLTFAFAQRHRPEPLLRAARRLLPTKSSGDPHDIKFPVAIFEDLELISPEWRPHLLAAAAFSFWGSDRPDIPVMEKVREAVRKL